MGDCILNTRCKQIDKNYFSTNSPIHRVYGEGKKKSISTVKYGNRPTCPLQSKYPMLFHSTRYIVSEVYIHLLLPFKQNGSNFFQRCTRTVFNLFNSKRARKGRTDKTSLERFEITVIIQKIFKPTKLLSYHFFSRGHTSFGRNPPPPGISY